ncbi:MAG: formyltransferase family protein [Chloroflexi bacterium]|nr:formyltransferase family protein [Chloroflexota bacterium]
MAKSYSSKVTPFTGVVTTAVPLQQWAQSHHIPTFTLSKNLAAELQEREPFDYLFSITNLAILPEALLVLPQKGAINFHDGPLPRYAGLYATSWALLNQELIHGVTWHTMTAAVDEGLLLKQQLFPHSGRETAFSSTSKRMKPASNPSPPWWPTSKTTACSPRHKTWLKKATLANMIGRPPPPRWIGGKAPPKSPPWFTPWILARMKIP